MSYFNEVFQGMAEYFAVNKLLAVCFAILLYEFFVHERLSHFIRYNLVVLLLVLIPPVAVVLLIYQPAIYEYGFVWTLVPVIALASYAVVRFMWDILPGMEKSGRWRYFVGISVICGLVYFSGNREILQTVSLEEAALRSGYEQVADSLSEGTVLWGPRDLMQWVRRKNGDIKLVYGLDMWDATAAAYDGDPYGPELTAAYEWMQAVEGYTVYVENSDVIWFDIPEEVILNVEAVFEDMENAGVDVIVFPTATYEQLKVILPAGHETREVGKYTLLQGK